MAKDFSKSFWRNRVRELANKPRIQRGDLGKISIPLSQVKPLRIKKVFSTGAVPFNPNRKLLNRTEVKQITNVSLPKTAREVRSLDRFVKNNPRIEPSEAIVRWRTTNGSNTISGRIAKRWLANKLFGKQIKAKKKALAKRLNMSTTLRL